MANDTYQEFEKLFASLSPRPKAALEVGALPDERCVLASTTLADVPNRTGINLTESGSFGGVDVQQGDARKLPFEDNSFDLVVSRSTLEHIPDYWTACDEMRRVLAPGGTLIACVPGYGQSNRGSFWRRWAFRMKLPDRLKRSTPTFYVHDAPHDYHRYSEYAVTDIILSGLNNTEVWTIMHPPRIFGLGQKPPLPPQ
jgi:SAM-dependent methyltransferase